MTSGPDRSRRPPRHNQPPSERCLTECFRGPAAGAVPPDVPRCPERALRHPANAVRRRRQSSGSPPTAAARRSRLIGSGDFLRERTACNQKPHYRLRATEGPHPGGAGAGSGHGTSPVVLLARSFGRRQGAVYKRVTGRRLPQEVNHAGRLGNTLSRFSRSIQPSPAVPPRSRDMVQPPCVEVRDGAYVDGVAAGGVRVSAARAGAGSTRP
jgi:hypothetical protein